jgi:catechol 2,3-dioxygenase-like lactoylglutathione lyase family enzyme
MQGFIGVLRIWTKRAAILLAVGAVLQFAFMPTPGQAGAQRAAPLREGVAQGAPKRPRITGIDHVRLFVANREKSIDFYSKFIGAPTNKAYGCRTASHPCFPVWIDQQIELEQAPSPAPKNWLAQIAYRTDDVIGMRRFLLAHHIGTTPISEDHNGARHFELRDPEGNPLAFIQRSEIDPDFTITNNRVGTRLIHAGFVVKNMAQENRFYLDLLGFKLYWYGGFKDDGVDWYEIQVPDGPDWIEYMLNIPANADHKELGVQNHFSLGVKDIHAAADQLRKNGIAKFDGPEIGRDGKWGLDAYDPDGTRVEVMEFTPAKTPCCHPYTAPHPTP